jgi:hypothetical protein
MGEVQDARAAFAIRRRGVELDQVEAQIRRMRFWQVPVLALSWRSAEEAARWRASDEADALRREIVETLREEQAAFRAAIAAIEPVSSADLAGAPLEDVRMAASAATRCSTAMMIVVTARAALAMIDPDDNARR